MDSAVKQRLIGAAVLVALAIIFLPMLVKRPAPDSGVADLSLDVPAQPQAPGTVTRELPLMTPPQAPAGGALAAHGQTDEDGPLPTVDTADVPDAPHPDAAELADAPQEAAPAAPALPASVAGGDYVVHFGSYRSSVDADTVVNRLRAARLPANSARADGNGGLWRVRIGPYASRADAEAVRVQAATIGANDARVIVLDAAPASAPAAREAAPAPTPAQAPETPAPRQQPAPVAATPPADPAPAPAAADVGFVVQLGAFSSAEDADALRARAVAAGFTVFTQRVQTERGAMTRVVAGPVASRADADRLKSQIQGRIGVDGLVRAHP